MNIDLAPLKSFAATHKKTLALVGAALLLLFIGFVSGRYTSTPKVETKVVTKTQVQTQVVYRDHVVTQKVYVQAEKKHVHKETTTTKTPDGTTTTKTTEDDNTDETASTHSTQDAQHQQVVTQVVTQTVFKDKLVLKQPDWRATVGAGVSLPYYLGQGSLGIPGLNGYVVQVGVDRRIVGPFWLGIFGNTQGTLGLSLSAVW